MSNDRDVWYANQVAQQRERERERDERKRQQDYVDRVSRERDERNRQSDARSQHVYDHIRASQGSEDHQHKTGTFGLYQSPAPSWSSGTSKQSNKVICTELHRVGLMSREDYDLCHRDMTSRLQPRHLKGYLTWGPGVVRLMRRKPWATRLFRVIAQARVDHIAWLQGDRARRSLLGAMLVRVGEPICGLVGDRVLRRKARSAAGALPAR